MIFGRSSDLFLFNRLPIFYSGIMDKLFSELTATGIVLDFHQIPFLIQNEPNTFAKVE